jgi:hypothetical protein
VKALGGGWRIQDPQNAETQTRDDTAAAAIP